ncbi:40S ribosomal protein SA-like, partial [Cricetulus griseus]|uniref:40S ribosomal protein SA-like n=1 Tax=Cricetulus griseus TaxID=10029 RepID=UPI0015C4031F
MSGALDVLQMKEDDVLKFLAAGTHLGGTNFDFQMEQYIYKRKNDGIYIINLKRTWEKLLLAARPIVATENPADVRVISSRNTGQQTVLKFAAATGATPIAGRFTPGTFTNQIQEEFQGEWTAPAPEFTAAQPEVADWSEGVQVPSVPIQQFPTADWNAQPATGTGQQLPQCRSPSGLEPPLSGPELLCRHLSKGKKGGRKIKFLRA